MLKLVSFEIYELASLGPAERSNTLHVTEHIFMDYYMAQCGTSAGYDSLNPDHVVSCFKPPLSYIMCHRHHGKYVARKTLQCQARK